jgi:hypothetical protein
MAPLATNCRLGSSGGSGTRLHSVDQQMARDYYCRHYRCWGDAEPILLFGAEGKVPILPGGYCLKSE